MALEDIESGRDSGVGRLRGRRPRKRCANNAGNLPTRLRIWVGGGKDRRHMLTDLQSHASWLVFSRRTGVKNSSRERTMASRRQVDSEVAGCLVGGLWIGGEIRDGGQDGGSSFGHGEERLGWVATTQNEAGMGWTTFAWLPSPQLGLWFVDF